MSEHTTPSTPIAPQSSVCSLLTWKDPVATGKVFGIVLGSLILVKINIFNHAFHLAYIGLLLAAAAEYSGRLITGQGFLQKYAGSPKSRTDTFRNKVLPALGDAAETIESEVQRIVYGQDLEATLKAAGVSYILYKLTSWFSLYSLLVAIVLLAFSLPAVYQSNKKEIDAAVAQYTKIAKQKTSEFTAVAHKKIAPHLETLAKKTGPVGSFIQSKFPTRTAGSTVGSSKVSADEPAVGVSTGASKFPDVPSTASTTKPVDHTASTVEPSL